MQVDDAGLRDFLIDSGALSRRQLDQVGVDEGPLYDALSRRAVISHDELRRAAAGVCGVPFVVLERDDIALEALLYIPEPIARTHNIAGFRLTAGTLEVALLDLDDLDVIEFLEAEKGVRILPRLTNADSLKRALVIYHKHLKETFGDTLRGKSDPANAADALLSHALLHRAGAVHISPREFLSGQGELLVRYRIGGNMFDAMTLPREAGAIVHRFKELANISFTMPAPQEGGFRALLQGEEEVRVRVSTAPSVQGERMVLHLNPQGGAISRKGFTLESLGFHGGSLERMHTVFQKKSGLVLIAGKAGSGPIASVGAGITTTLYTMLDMVASPHTSAATIEEHIGQHLPHIAQTQVRGEVGLTMPAALRALLKQDPHIVMIDSVSEAQTAMLAASAASRGVLVIAGVEAQGSAEAINQFLNFGVPGKLLASVLLASVGVGVARKVCRKCKEEYRLSRAEAEPLGRRANFGRILAMLKEEGAVSNDIHWKDIMFPHAVGCGECEGGYAGMTGLQEVLIPTMGAKDLIKESAFTSPNPEDMGLTLAEDGLFKAAQGITSIEEVVRAMEP